MQERRHAPLKSHHVNASPTRGQANEEVALASGAHCSSLASKGSKNQHYHHERTPSSMRDDTNEGQPTNALSAKIGAMVASEIVTPLGDISLVNGIWCFSIKPFGVFTRN